MASIVRSAQTTLSENLGGIAHKLAPRDTQFTFDDIPPQTGKVAVVTGGSQGIGYGVTHTLLSKDIAKLFILSSSAEVVATAKAAVAEELGAAAAARTHWIQCDLADWRRVGAAAQEIRAQTDRLDILVNNAGRGIMTFQVTEDTGVDRHMALNHFGHVLLTSHLLPLLKATADKHPETTVRISNQASNAHQSAPKDTKFASLAELNTDFGPMPQYGRSKLAAILYSKYLARHLSSSHPRILANATHPGVVETKMSRDDIHEPYPRAGYLMSKGLQPFKKDQFEGAVSTLFAVTAAQKSGEYICPPAAVEEGSELARDEELGEQLMRLTREVLVEKLGGEEVPEFY